MVKGKEKVVKGSWSDMTKEMVSPLNAPCGQQTEVIMFPVFQFYRESFTHLKRTWHYGIQEMS